MYLTEDRTMHLTGSAPIRRVLTLVLMAGGVALTPSLHPGAAAASSPRSGILLLQAYRDPKFVAAAASSPRSGILHVRKDCSHYTGRAGSFCTITSSNLKALRVGSKIIYLKKAGPDLSIDSDIVIRVRPGTTVFGHCTVSATNVGGCTLAGGTGRFTHFHARVAVALVSGNLYSWDGPYSFSPGR